MKLVSHRFYINRSYFIGRLTQKIEKEICFEAIKIILDKKTALLNHF